jgi:hypothetical protein
MNDNNSDLYKNLSYEQKIICDKQSHLRNIIIIQNIKSKQYFKEMFIKYFPDVKIKTNDIINIVKEFTKISIDKNFNDEINKIKNNYVKKFIQNQISINNIIIDFNAIIIGCPESKDIDIIIIIDEKYDIDKININNIDIINQLQYKCIYKLDKTKNIDRNIIHIKNKKVIKSQKGSIKTLQGIIYYTQHLHIKKKFYIDIIKPDKFNIEDRIIPPINFILYNLDIFCGKEKAIELRDKKIFAINSNEKDKVSFIIDNNIMNIILDELIIINDRNKDYIKALFVKLSTIILIHNNMSDNTDYYTKRGLAKLIDKIYQNTYQYSIYYLFRSNEGVFNKDFLKIIFDEYIYFANTYIQNYDYIWKKIDIDIQKSVKYIDTDIQKFFWENTIEPTKSFIDYFDMISSDTNIEKHFIIKSTDEKQYNFDIIPEFKKHISFVDQRSEEWFKLREIYPPNNVIKDNKYTNYPRSENWIKEIYHLIVGSIGEQYVMYNIDWNKIFNGYEFISVGMIIDYVEKYSISPDGFLINLNTKDIIPIEIKCIRNEKNLFSKTIMREIKMAKQQLQTINKIICCKKGIIVFFYINQNNMFCEYTMIEL